jgi:hypothetical protein
MSWRCFWWALVACVCCSGIARAQGHQDDTPLTDPLERSLDVMRGSLDALRPSYPTFLMPRQESVESRFTVGMADNWESGLAYRFVSCPRGSFPSRENAGLRFSYDDSRFWETSFPSFTGLQPSATMGFEANDRWRRPMDTGLFLQLGIRPGYELELPGRHPVVASLPVTLGLNSEYDELARTRTSNPGFGFLDIGLAVSTPLSARSKHGSSWGLTAGVNFLFLGEGREVLNGGDDFEVIGSITLGFEF